MQQYGSVLSVPKGQLSCSKLSLLWFFRKFFFQILRGICWNWPLQTISQNTGMLALIPKDLHPTQGRPFIKGCIGKPSWIYEREKHLKLVFYGSGSLLNSPNNRSKWWQLWWVRPGCGCTNKHPGSTRHRSHGWSEKNDLIHLLSKYLRAPLILL